jgi:gas vesicle protein
VKFLLPLLVLGIIVAFFFALIAPRQARRAQERVSDKTKDAEDKLRSGNESSVADWTATSLEWSRKAGEKSVDAGTTVRDKLTPN